MTVYYVKAHPIGTLLAGMLALTTVAAGVGAQSPCPPREKIVFTNGDPSSPNPIGTAEIHIMNPDGSDASRLTDDGFGDSAPALSKDDSGKIVFDSNRTAIALGAPLTSTASDLFLMNHDGTSESALNPTPLTRGSSATWSPDGKWIAYHRSRAGAYGPRIPGRGELGGPTIDSDIFVVNLDDLLTHGEQPLNLTESLGPTSDDDADWSPDGSRIAFTSRSSACPNGPACRAQGEIWVINTDGTNPQRLTFNSLEERSPDWSPDGTKIVYMCRLGVDTPFEICVMNSSGIGDVEVLTSNVVPDLTPGWSPDGTRLSFFRGSNLQEQIYVMNYLADENGDRHEEALTAPPSISLFPAWGTVAVGCRGGVSSQSASARLFQRWTNAALDLYQRWFARPGGRRGAGGHGAPRSRERPTMTPTATATAPESSSAVEDRALPH